MIIKPMKRYCIKDYIITRLNNILEKQYNCKYLITINKDIVYFGNTLKECKNVVNLQYKEKEL